MTIENVQGIVWDLDGTLLDSFGIFEQVLTDVVTENGYSMPSLETIRHNFHGSLEETVQRILHITSIEELDATILSFLARQESHYAGNLASHLFPDASLLAKRAAKAGIHQLLVTNRAHLGRGKASPWFIIATTILAKYIHQVNPADEVAYRKPDPRSMGDWIERHNLLPEQVVVIGDQFVDAQLANNIGARAIIVKRHDDIPYLDDLTEKSREHVTIVDTLEDIILNR